MSLALPKLNYMHTCKPVSCSLNHFHNTAQVLWLYPRLVLGKYKYKKATECRWCQFSSCYGKSMKQHSLGNQAFNLFSSLATRIYWCVCFTRAPGFQSHCAAIKAKGIIFKNIQKMKKQNKNFFQWHIWLGSLALT